MVPTNKNMLLKDSYSSCEKRPWFIVAHTDLINHALFSCQCVPFAGPIKMKRPYLPPSPTIPTAQEQYYARYQFFFCRQCIIHHSWSVCVCNNGKNGHDTIVVLRIPILLTLHNITLRTYFYRVILLLKPSPICGWQTVSILICDGSQSHQQILWSGKKKVLCAQHKEA